MLPPLRATDTAHPALRLALLAAAAALLLAAESCRLSPLAPVRDLGESAAIGIGDAASAGGWPVAPPIGAIGITREGDQVRFSIEVLPGGETSPEFAGPGAGAPAPWTFRLDLDTDQDPDTGDENGADVALVAGTDGRIGVWRRAPSGWEQTQTAPLTWTRSRIAFELPAAALDEDDGLMDYSLDIYGIRTSSSAPDFIPAASYAGRSGPLPDERMLVPAISHLRGEVRHGFLYLSGRMNVRGHRTDVQYSPYQPGGWCLQVFLNTDRQATGYWLGFDYIVRGVEWNPASGASVVRRITLEPGYPGGWGPESGVATLQVIHGDFSIAIPLTAIGDAGGDLDFVLETYATVACPDCEPGYTQEFAADYFGGSSTNGHPLIAGNPGPTTRGPARWSLLPGGARSATADRTHRALATTR
jgi:hypothetical protein